MKIQWQAPIKALEKWQPEIRAASSGDNEIDMYDIIGEGLYTQGVTLNYVSQSRSFQFFQKVINGQPLKHISTCRVDINNYIAFIGFLQAI